MDDKLTLRKTILADLAAAADRVNTDLPRPELIRNAVENRDALVAACGALATWTPPLSTGRRPKDTVMVRRPGSQGNIDWDSPNNLAIDETTFDMIFEDARAFLADKDMLFVTNRVVGADPAWSMPVTTVTDSALAAVFSDNMFRPVPADLARSVFASEPFTVLCLPWDELDSDRYNGRLRVDPDTKKTANVVIAIDYDRHMGIIIGSAYLGSLKKMVFTVMNYYLPDHGILPLHCSANEGADGHSALMLGLSGTGKTTLSADPERALLGDDEHGWGSDGVANMENGCYAKLIDLNPRKEPEIFKAVFHDDDYMNHGSIIENAMMYPCGEFDLTDRRLTENSRASYPLTYLSNIKPSSCSGHPNTILFLTADANGVLPAIARLNRNQAMLWFLMGYTSKLAGTETGVVSPSSTFSRFFGAPFMPRLPSTYADMLGDMMEKHDTDVYLVNTGWIGGMYGTVKRCDIDVTRAMVKDAVEGRLKNVPCRRDPFFKFDVPEFSPSTDNREVLNPEGMWADKEAFKATAGKLAAEFKSNFAKAFGNKGIAPEIAAECPGH